MNRLKDILLGFIICYSLIIIVFTIINFNKLNQKVEITKNEVYTTLNQEADKKINDLENLILSEKDLNCFKSIKILKQDSNKSFIENKKLTKKELINNYYDIASKGLLGNYLEVIDTCDLSEEDKKIINNQVMSAVTFSESIYQDNMFSYELKFEDNFTRKIMEADIFNIGIKANKNIEMIIVNSLLEKLGERYA